MNSPLEKRKRWWSWSDNDDIRSDSDNNFNDSDDNDDFDDFDDDDNDEKGNDDFDDDEVDGAQPAPTKVCTRQLIWAGALSKLFPIFCRK